MKYALAISMKIISFLIVVSASTSGEAGKDLSESSMSLSGSTAKYRPVYSTEPKGRSGQEHLTSVNFCFPKSLEATEAKDFCSDWSNLSTYKREKLTTYKNLYIEGKRQYTELDEENYRELFYNAVKNFQRKRSQHQRAYYIRTKLGLNLRTNEADLFRRGQIQQLKDKEGIEEVERRRLRTESSYKSRVKKLLREDPNNSYALELMRKKGWTLEELEQRKCGRKHRGSLHVGSNSTEGDLKNQVETTVPGTSYAHVIQGSELDFDLNEPASFSD